MVFLWCNLNVIVCYASDFYDENCRARLFWGGRVNYLKQCMSCAHISEFVLLQSAEILGFGDGKLTNIFLKMISSPFSIEE